MTPFHPCNIYDRARTIEGFDDLRKSMESTCRSGEVILESLKEICEEYSDWDSDQGFGSSDTVYAVMSFINMVIINANLTTVYKVAFIPRLTIFKI